MILWHHIATFLLLLIPLRHPELGRYTCADGLIEWNTFFLVARRQVSAECVAAWAQRHDGKLTVSCGSFQMSAWADVG